MQALPVHSKISYLPSSVLQLTKQGGRVSSSNNVLKPTPTLLNAGGIFSAGVGPGGGLSSSALNGAMNGGSLNGMMSSTSLSGNGVLVPSSLSPPFLSTTSTISGAGGQLNVQCI